MKFLSLICLIGLIYTVQAGVYTNTPYEGVTWTGGQTYPINWVDDNNKPSLDELNDLTIELCAGTEKNHHFVATIGNAKGTAKTISYSVPAKIGPEGNFYFIKYHQGDNIYFSARFTIKGISGTIPDFDPANPDKVVSTKESSTSSSTKDSTTKTTVNTATTTDKNKSSAINSTSGGPNKKPAGPTGPTGPSGPTSGSAATPTSAPSPSSVPKGSNGSQISCSYSFLISFLTIAALASLVY